MKKEGRGKKKKEIVLDTDSILDLDVFFRLLALAPYSMSICHLDSVLLLSSDLRFVQPSRHRASVRWSVSPSVCWTVGPSGWGFDHQTTYPAGHQTSVCQSAARNHRDPLVTFRICLIMFTIMSSFFFFSPSIVFLSPSFARTMKRIILETIWWNMFCFL